MQVCKDKGISVRKLGLETKGQCQISQVVEGILKQDLDQFFVQQLKKRCGMDQEKKTAEKEVVNDDYVE